MSDSAIDFNPQGKKTMLTVDGGGARGIIPLMILQKLELDTGRPAHELFDFVCGTSVGALIAASIAVGHSAEEIITLYHKFIASIFKIDYFAVAFRHGLRYLYDKTAAREVLREALGDVRLKDLPIGALFTTKDVVRGETIFFVSRGPGARVTGDVMLRQVVEASASAPIYFEPVGDCVDGGVGTYGNTCYVATVEALEYMSRQDPAWRDGNVIHVSVGTGLAAQARQRGEARRWLPLGWPLWIINDVLDEAGDASVQITARHYGSRIDFRRYNVSLLDSVVREELGVAIPPGMESNKLSLASASAAEVALLKAIGTAYAAHLDFTRTGAQLIQSPPPGSTGSPYPSRLARLTAAEVQAMLSGKAVEAPV